MRTAHSRRMARRMPSLDLEDRVVDFNDASLYLPLAQTVFSICACAAVSVLSCWLAPSVAVSAVRTLALCSATGGLLMRTPVRLGKAHGITVVFSALQLSIPLYLGTLVVEQLVHTCSLDASHAQSWRHVIFHVSVLAMVCAGFMRARAPLEDTDRPFIITLIALMVIAMIPPPALALVGPLCQPVTLWDAADRIVRAFCFAMVYCVTVYASTRTVCTNYSCTPTIFFRSASASIWVCGALVWWLPLAVAQCAIIMHARAVHNNAPPKEYKKVERTDSTDEDDIEADLVNFKPKLADPVAEQNRLLNERPFYTEDAIPGCAKAVLSSNLKLNNASSVLTADMMQSVASAGHEPVGQLQFQQLTLVDPPSETDHDAFFASVAKAMAHDAENSH